MNWLTGTKHVVDKARPEGYKEGRSKVLEEMEPIVSHIDVNVPSKVRHVGKLLPLMRQENGGARAHSTTAPYLTSCCLAQICCQSIKQRSWEALGGMPLT